MSSQLTFNEAKEKYLEKLKKYVPIVSRVHGGSHPEFQKVHKLFDAIIVKIKEEGPNKPELNEEFAKLVAITDDYTVPGDVCETFEGVYIMFAELDRAYHT